MNWKKWMGLILGSLGAMLVLAACTSDADRASQNVSVAAENFEVNRLIVGVNLHTDQVLFSVEGACSIERDGDLVVICKEGPDTFKKHYIGLGPNAGDGITYVSTQLDPVVASVYHTRIILKPQNIVPNFDLQTGTR